MLRLRKKLKSFQKNLLKIFEKIVQILFLLRRWLVPLRDLKELLSLLVGQRLTLRPFSLNVRTRPGFGFFKICRKFSNRFLRNCIFKWAKCVSVTWAIQDPFWIVNVFHYLALSNSLL